ncbi:hypothetical protein [Nocardia sp. CA-119907]|uniref:hypothetical protein n=1 Tax=Nocardia sp. CA-119907 TaxID=3239973 RepID=UPI003D96B528
MALSGQGACRLPATDVRSRLPAAVTVEPEGTESLCDPGLFGHPHMSTLYLDLSISEYSTGRNSPHTSWQLPRGSG